MTLASFHDLGLPTESVAVRNNSLQPVRVSTITRWLPWVARVAWVFVAVVGGQAIEAAVDGRSAAVRWVAGVGGWAAWGVVLGALLIASVRSLTIVRVGVPVSAAVAIAVVVAGVSPADLLSFVVPAAVTLFVVFTAEFGRSFVQASAYGDEERFPLRPPAAVGVAAVVTWLVWAAAIVAGPLLLAAHSWIAGAVVTVVAVAGTVLLAPRWHRLSRRWLVLVPAGIVVHDPVVLADTVSLRTNQVRRHATRAGIDGGRRPHRPGERLRRGDRDHRDDHGRVRLHAAGTERARHPPHGVPRRSEPAGPGAGGSRPPRPSRRVIRPVG